MPKTSKKRLRSDEFKIPHIISREDFDILCKTYRIPSAHRQLVQERLDLIVKEFAAWMANVRKQPDRGYDRESLVEAQSHIEKAVAQINKLGPSGRHALKITSRSLAPMLAAQWINEKFPDDDYAPRRSVPPSGLGNRKPMHTNPRAAEYFIEEHSLEARHRFVRNRAVQVASATLRTIGEGLSDSLRDIEHQPGAGGGPKPLTYRHDLIVNLAQLWVELGRTVSTGPKSDFTSFCETVAKAIGWPVSGMNSAIPDALNDWRNLA
jgi:hypothetical protein